MLKLAKELGLTVDDLSHWPHHIAAELAEGCYWDEECWALYDKREYSPSEDWHAHFKAEADIALAGGLEGVITYLLSNFWEKSVEKFLRNPAENADLTPEQMARRSRLYLWADATFPRPAYWFRKQAAKAWEGRSDV
jgi:hypothetical protein